MKSKVLTFLLALTFIVSIVGVSLAEFDYSVFEKNENFEVKIDDFDDTPVSIELGDKFAPITVDTSDGKATDIMIKIETLGNEQVRMFLILIKVKGVHNFKDITLLPDKTRYTIEVKGSPESGYETIGFPVTSDLIPMFDEVIEKQITSVRYRLRGDDNVDSVLAINVEQLKLLIDLYKEAGGMNQDFSTFRTMYPVTVK